MKSKPLAGLVVAILLFGAYTSVALPSQSKADTLENQTPRVYTMKIYVGDDAESSTVVQYEVKQVNISLGETDSSAGGFVSDMIGASESKSSGSGKFLQGLISSILDSDSSGSRPLDFGSALDLKGSGGTGIGSGISRALDKVQTLSEILSIFSSVLSAI